MHSNDQNATWPILPDWLRSKLAGVDGNLPDHQLLNLAWSDANQIRFSACSFWQEKEQFISEELVFHPEDIAWIAEQNFRFCRSVNCQFSLATRPDPEGGWIVQSRFFEEREQDQ